MIDDAEWGALGMKIGRENRSSWRNPAPLDFVHHKSHTN
jgi:hypothetical protein